MPSREPAIPRLLLRLIHPADRDLIVGDLLEEYTDSISSGRSGVRARLRLYLDLARAGLASRWHMRGLGASHPSFDDSPRMRMGGAVGSFRSEVQLAVRSLRRRPGFAFSALLTTALGLGSAMAMFSVVNTVLLRPLPYDAPDRIHLVGTTQPRVDGLIVSQLDIVDLRREASYLDAVAEWQRTGSLMEEAGVLIRVSGASVPRSFFSLLGVTPEIGRFFGADDDPESGTVPVVVSYEFWTTRLGSDPNAIFGAAPFCPERCVIVGVTRRGFVDPVGEGALGLTPEFWRLDAMRAPTDPSDRGNFRFWAVARLADGVEVESARAGIESFSADLEQRFPETNRDRRLRLVSAREAIVGGSRTTVLSLFGAVLLLFAISAVNVANLLLIRATERRNEMAVRSSLGASRLRLMRQLLTEGLVLGTVGASMGLVIAGMASIGARQIPNGWIPLAAESSIDSTTLLFGVAATLGTVLLFGLVPGLGVLDRRLASTIRNESGRVTRSGRMRGLLLSLQTALSAILLIGAGLLGRSLWELRTTETGVSVESALSFRVSFPSTSFPDRPAIARAVKEVEARLAARSGVDGVAAVGQLPFGTIQNSTNVIPEVEFASITPEETALLPRYPIRAVTPDYFDTMGMEVLSGRGFTDADADGAVEVAVIDQTLAAALFEGDAVGERVVVRGVTLEIVGMVSSVRLFGPSRPPQPMLYTSYTQERQGFMISPASFVVRTASGSYPTAAELRTALDGVDPSLMLSDIRPLEEELARHFGAPRFRTLLVLVFAGVATLLCAIGVAGVVGYGVAQRRRELAIRIALGAQNGSISVLVVRQSAVLSGVGLVLGVLGAAWIAPRLASLLYEVGPYDPFVFTAVSLVLVGTTLVAAFVPVRRAVSVDPSMALREGG